MRMFETTRTVSADCIEDSLPEGTLLFEFIGPMYGYISPNGIACSYFPGEGPFFEVPRNALKEI